MMIKPKFRSTIDSLGIVGMDPAFTRMLAAACKFAQNEVNVLIVGESGTGRSTIARLIHEIRHPGESFYEADCRLMDRFVRAELIGPSLLKCGDEVVRIKPDPDEVRHTLLLRDVHDVGAAFGNDLASFLRTKKLETVDFGKVCVIATADRDEGKICKEAEGLAPFLRHFDAEVKVPSLDERRGDIVLLAKAFLEAWNAQNGRKIRFAGQALQRLQRRPWPGNLVELERVVKMAAMVSDDDLIRAELIEPEEGEETVVAPAEDIDFGAANLDDHIEGVKRRWVREALARSEGKKSAAAELLGWSPQRLHKYLTTEASRGHSFWAM